MGNFEDLLKSDKQAREDAVNTRGHNMLLSAAAGSGKTYTLVERLAKIIDDGGEIDKFLVVTFTNKAVQELKERIAAKLAKMDSEHARQQMVLAAKAHINTIDSFCLDVVRRHFAKIDIDPDFTADEKRVFTIQNEELEKILEEKYAKNDENAENYKIIKEIVDIECSLEDDDDLRDKIIKMILSVAENQADPTGWLESIKSSFDDKDIWIERYAELINGKIQDVLEQIEYTKKIIADNASHIPDAMLAKYEAGIEQDVEIFKKMNKKGTDIFSLSDDISWGKIPSASSKDPDLKAIQEKIRDNRNEYKEVFDKFTVTGTGKNKKNQNILEYSTSLDDLLKKAYGDTLPTFPEDYGDAEKKAAARKVIFERGLEKMQAYVGVLIDIAVETYNNTLQKSKEAGIYSFTQIQHFAYEILQNEDICREYIDQFDEIYIDEYQDTNEIQEKILTMVSKASVGRQNVFVVGDVKQAIYGFRLATPEFFMEKYNAYKKDEAKGLLKIMSKNFRSRNEVLQGTNVIFEQIMTEKTCGIEYKDGHSLICGRSDLVDEETGRPLQAEAKPANKCEIIYVSKAEKKDKEKAEETPEEGLAATTTIKLDLECACIADRIARLFEENFKIYDDKKGERPIRFGDICIIARKNKSLFEIRKYLAEKGFPVATCSDERLTERPEIISVLDYLRIIDNPLLDYPLYALLLSRFYGFTEVEIAALRILAGKKVNLIQNLIDADKIDLKKLENKDSDFNAAVLTKKCSNFVKDLTFFRQEAKKVPLSSLIFEIITGFAPENGKSFYDSANDCEKANLREFVKYAKSFDTGKNSGLYGFLRYIDTSDEKSLPTAATFDAGENAINFFTMHKSKGLEYPVVILTRASGDPEVVLKKKTFFIDKDLGIGYKYLFDKEVTPEDSVPLTLLKNKEKRESRNESMRGLYVALTRAREKVIVTANSDKAFTPKVPTTARIKAAKTYLEFLELGASHTDFDKYWDVFVKNEEDAKQFDEKIAERVQAILAKAKGAEVKTEEISTELPAEADEFIETINDFEKIANEATIPSKLSVSKLKKLRQTEDGEIVQEDGSKTSKGKRELDKLGEVIADAKVLYDEIEDFDEASDTNETAAEALDQTAQKSEQKSGAKFGTAMHKIIELLTKEREIWPKATESDEVFADFIKNCLEKWQKNKKIDSETAELASDFEMITRFLKSPLSDRIRATEAIRCEVPFTYRTNLEKYFKKEGENPEKATEKGKMVAIQGVIDLYFRDRDGIVLVDFKTDRIGDLDTFKDSETFASYKVQIECYKDAIGDITGEKVSDCLLYFLRTGDEAHI